MHMHDLVRQTLESLGADWWTFSASPNAKVETGVNYPLTTSEIKRACLEIAPNFSELRIHHLVACVLQRRGVDAYVIVGRDRSTDIISPAYRSWITVTDVGVVSTAYDVNVLCDEVIRLPSQKETLGQSEIPSIGGII